MPVVVPPFSTPESVFISQTRALHMCRRYNISVAEERRLALERLRVICNSGLLSILDFRDNALNIFAAHEVMAFAGEVVKHFCCKLLPCDALQTRLVCVASL